MAKRSSKETEVVAQVAETVYAVARVPAGPLGAPRVSAKTVRAILDRQPKYQPTQSTGLQALRDAWIPLQVDRNDEVVAVLLANSILDGETYTKEWTQTAEPVKILVAMLVVESWSIRLYGEDDKAMTPELNQRVAEFLASVDAGYAFLAIRSAGGAKEANGRDFMKHAKWVVKNPTYFSVFLSIRGHRFNA
jgi:ribosomal protein L11 methylase PrmA